MVVIMISVIIISFGAVSYWYKQEQLDQSGRTDLYHSTRGEIELLNHLQDRVEQGELPLLAAQEEAKILLSGPKLEDGKKDFHEALFFCKESDCMGAFSDDYIAQAHPADLEGEMLGDLQDSDDQYMIRDLFQASLSGHVKVIVAAMKEVNQEAESVDQELQSLISISEAAGSNTNMVAASSKKQLATASTSLSVLAQELQQLTSQFQKNEK
ncbi:cache domain-containing protein [Jeotgalibacillus soli]|uniref:Single Cache domain-containing protein n=1 Tax=Jeotgalibacillus soli TaxID=889306 RepID=A0A0C2R4M1_9BACL|nr:cache domain-containing protein [Jeotgalibacillus soli]KIL45215.1 hypothetical protein KP78_27590 [Jeotgalibacillus soli]